MGEIFQKLRAPLLISLISISVPISILPLSFKDHILFRHCFCFLLQSVLRIPDWLKESRTILGAETLGVSTRQDLHQQHQSLLHAYNALHGVDDKIGKSRKFPTGMSKRMDRSKWAIDSIDVVLVLDNSVDPVG
ncbi:hypothetical protein C4D60_Mb01t00240 [Musa balbisiana]|uniref:Uncharacterized protein n=1 Tax=Musa balbisiana TaxID=52838 RepID=A0A4S8JL80_MUSBA|nr:hypothetical protein C4D60_Mb01t00240 [Musa balbisiana]